jgi:hypothetical protein
MFSPHRRLATVASAVLMATGALAAAASMGTPATAVAGPCSMSIEPFNPYLQTCGIPNNPPVVRGASPGAGAIIACRDIPGCLSYVVNGGPGFPGYYGGGPRPGSTIRHNP